MTSHIDLRDTVPLTLHAVSVNSQQKQIGCFNHRLVKDSGYVLCILLIA